MQRSAGHAVPGEARPDRPEGPGFPILEAANSLMSFFQAKLEQEEIFHKVPPKSTDPVHFFSRYSLLQNVNIMLLDSRLGPTLSCLVAEKS